MTTQTETPEYTLTPRRQMLLPYVRQALFAQYVAQEPVTYSEFAKRLTILSGVRVHHREVGTLLGVYGLSLTEDEPNLRTLVVRADTHEPGVGAYYDRDTLLEYFGGAR